MRSTLDNPVKYFEDYFEHKVQRELSAFYKGEEILTNSSTDIIDRKNQTIKILDLFDSSKYIIYSFENYIKGKLEKEFQNSKNLIEKQVINLNRDKNQLISYIEVLQVKLYSLQNHIILKEVGFLMKYVQRLKKEVHSYSKLFNTREKVYSLTLLENPDNKKCEKLYKLLAENTPPLIQCDKKTFIKAFTGKPLKNERISWLVTGKNSKVSKSSLFYFVRELYSFRHLSPSIETDLSKYLDYIFRDNNGMRFQNLRTSKSKVSTNPAKKATLDSIINKLKE